MRKEVPEKRSFRWKNWRTVLRMGTYLKPHAWGYALGVVIISISGVLTLMVTRLWGQLGGVGTASSMSDGATDAAPDASLAFLPFDLNDLTEIGWLILVVLGVQALLVLPGSYSLPK